ncbi:MAG TPA: LLM class F420-dependent oxidoreductase [Streptosporangiaceae bacterium]|jgi:F420-dependent oxidoreductase-like protein|nr:LLM class F420-dependent oxidoreductase [Streptosporangiaceae bacterium]
MRLGASVGKGDPGVLRQRARDLEACGIDVLWVAELYGFDGPSMMGFLAAVTERVQIGSAILPFYSRSPALLAMTAAGVDALSGGRCILGIGASGPQVIEGFHGVPFDSPVGRTEELIEICRAIWRREPLEHDGRHYQIPLPEEQGLGLGKPLKLIDHPVRSSIPIFVAASGPKNVQTAARVADGWLPIFFWPERSAQVWGQPLAAGLRERDPSLRPLDVVASASVAIGDDLEELRDMVRPQLALYIGGMGAREMNFYNDLACRYGLEDDARRIQDLYLAGHKDEAARAVPAELVDGTTLIGPAGLVRGRLAAYAAAGVTVLNLRPLGPDPVGTIARVRELLP